MCIFWFPVCSYKICAAVLWVCNLCFLKWHCVTYFTLLHWARCLSSIHVATWICCFSLPHHTLRHVQHVWGCSAILVCLGLRGLLGHKPEVIKWEKSWSNWDELVILHILYLLTPPERKLQLASNHLQPSERQRIFLCMSPLDFCEHFSGIYPRTWNCWLTRYWYA